MRYDELYERDETAALIHRATTNPYRIGGRPKGNRSDYIKMYMKSGDVDRLNRLALKTGLPKSEIVRRALEEFEAKQ